MAVVTFAAAGAPPVEVRGGARYWVDSYRSMLRWHLASLRLWLMVLTMIQVLTGVGFVLGIGLLFAEIPPSAALFVSTGVPVINLIMVGLILGPQMVADQRIEGTYEYLQAMAVSKSAAAVAWYTVTLVGSVPAIFVGLGVAELRYDLPLHVSWAIVPAVLMTALAGTMLGYAVGHAMPSPMATRLVTQLLVFAVFGFTPILFPVGQLPRWLGALNWWLPFRHMAVVLRSGLTRGLVSGVAASYVVLTVWAVVCTALSARALGRRP